LVRFRRLRPAYVAIAAVSVLAWAALISIDAFERFYVFSRGHEGYQLDELMVLFVILAIDLLIILGLRNADLRREIGRRRSAEREAASLARYDALTGIANRRHFGEEFERRIVEAAGTSQRLGLLLLDLDRFKTVNDVHGHDAGDLLLRVVADRLRETVRREDVIARLGGDEFVVLISDVADKEAIVRTAKRILQVIQLPIETVAFLRDISVSIGIAVYPEDGEAASLLLQRADMAMYQAKAQGRNTFAVFDRQLGLLMRERADLEQQLKEALRHGEIVPHYQPYMNLATGQVVGVEGLARWRHPTRGLLVAGEFVPIAEEAGLIGEIFLTMLEQVCQDARQWAEPLEVAVNVSPLQFRDPRLPDKILSLLARHRFPPRRLEIEITESALVQDVAAAKAVVCALREAGIHVSLDDFGTGYSSFRHLHELPFDKLKIDQSFIQRLEGDDTTRKVVLAILELSRALGLITVAEGIETPAQAAWMAGEGCELGQGFLYSQAVPAACIAEMLALPAVLSACPASGRG